MILWLASYPKSGNTLLRSILASYFFSENGNFDFKHLYKIGQFPSLRHFKDIGVDTSNTQDIYANIIRAQEFINKSSGQLKFFKTHSALAKINNNHFTDLKNTIGAIYIIRDPRNVVSSFARHYQIDENKATKAILDENFWNYKNDILPQTFLSSWAKNYLSWKQLGLNCMIIKYEDLIVNKRGVLIKIFKFFEKLGLKIHLDMKKLNLAIKSTDFEKMKNLEKKFSFRESMVDNNTGERIPFFNLGPKNDWKKTLSNDNREKIEKSFKVQMLELGYL